MNLEMTSILYTPANLIFKIKMFLMHMELMAPICSNPDIFPLGLLYDYLIPDTVFLKCHLLC